ncbi:Pyridine nucleotide-disulphide oxidoreductase [Legionella beliardensis]|uniref:Pyridine nucleotide-disulphide oxidoreductase n=1 Tax=Legionella beliardensis TaxID=91822 RepID=A0A378I3H5_9GAMM|nr:hypothetical protein [Legionella beliardensis]STX29718.1 Pyridine nucleotide-disulphide oxidoreductase [Legionella beliardensis]
MPHVVIIGAGPTGLDLANKLKQKGIRDIIIYDPRAGDYVRPGYLNPDIFEQAEAGLKTSLHFNKKTSHIRDIEKKLYSHAISQHIPIEKKQFVRFPDEEKGIYIAHQNEQHELVEEFVPCEYVFDCTGSKRVLAHDINGKHERDNLAKPFVTSAVSQDVIIKNHLIAYLKIDDNLASKAKSPIPSQTTIFSGKTHLEIAEALEKLRAFGWTELTVPACHHTNFKENKNCFYIECPNNLPPEQKQAWLDTVLSLLTDTTIIQYEHMESKKGRSKPNFNIFTVNPQQLNCFTYHKPGSPHVVILGDAQIEPNFVLGHGIAGSFERIQTLVKGMVIINGKINYYDAEEYNTSVNGAIKTHQKEIINYYQMRKKDFRKGVYDAKIHYEAAITQTTNNVEKAIFIERLEEINARIAYYNALETLEKKIVNGKAQLSQNNCAGVLKELTDAKNAIAQSLGKLTDFEQKEATQILQQLILVFKTAGNQIFQQANYNLAIKAYQEALSLYTINGINKDEERLTLYSNLMLCYRKTGPLDKVLETFKEASFFLDNANDALKKKILFHVIKAIDENLNAPNLDNNKRSEHLSSFASLMKTHGEFIETHLADGLKVELGKLTDKLAEAYSSRLNDDSFTGSQRNIESSLNL